MSKVNVHFVAEAKNNDIYEWDVVSPNVPRIGELVFVQHFGADMKVKEVEWSGDLATVAVILK